MPLFFYTDSLYLILVLPALIFTIWAQIKVKTTYSKYSKVASVSGMTGYDIAREILDSNGLNYITIEKTEGNLTDHYDPRANTVRLSEGVYNSKSVAALGIAAHECGHAVQHAKGYAPMKLRAAIIPISQLGSSLTFPLIFASFIFQLPFLFTIAIIFFGIATLFQLITLPVEFNASRRAVKELEMNNSMSEEDISGTKKVLTAAALTYVAALAASLLNLLYLILRNRR